jgi:precorrin-4/cobalt-precorrin-4 C11-methyltransferase
MERTALILIGPALGQEGFAESALYSEGYDRRFRPQTADSVYKDSRE